MRIGTIAAITIALLGSAGCARFAPTVASASVSNELIDVGPVIAVKLLERHAEYALEVCGNRLGMGCRVER